MMKLNTMNLNDSNFAISAVNSEALASVAGGVSSLVVARNYALFRMANMALADKLDSMREAIKKLEDAPESETRDAQLILNRDKLVKLEADEATTREAMKKAEATYNAVIKAIFEAGNTRYNAERILAVCALDGNKSLTAYAFDWEAFKTEILDALARATVGVKYNADGTPVINADVRKAHKSAMNHVKLLIKNAFSLKTESIYFKRTMTTPDGEDMKRLVLTFLRDFTPARRDGAVVYDDKLSGWNEVRARVVKIVLKHMMNA